MGFVLGSLAVVLALGAILVLVGQLNERRDVEILDWKPTRSPQLEAENEIADVQQMIEAQNELRGRRGAPPLDEARLRAEIEAEEIERLRAARGGGEG